MVTEGNIHKPQVYKKLVAGEVQYLVCYCFDLIFVCHLIFGYQRFGYAEINNDQSFYSVNQPRKVS